MKYSPSALIGRLSRSAGSTTASHNRYGAYLRNRVIPTNPASTAQTAVRDRLGTLSAAWRSLTAAQRLAWEALAPSFVRTDSLGEPYTLNGFGAFMSVNQNLLAIGASQLSDPPTYNPPPALVSGVVTAAVALPSMSLAFSASPLGTGTKLLSFATRPVSAGKNFMPNGEYKLIDVSAAAATTPLSLLTDWEAVFGTLSQVGEKIFFKFKVVDPQGLSNAVLQTSAIVAT